MFLQTQTDLAIQFAFCSSYRTSKMNMGAESVKGADIIRWRLGEELDTGGEMTVGVTWVRCAATPSAFPLLPLPSFASAHLLPSFRACCTRTRASPASPIRDSAYRVQNIRAYVRDTTQASV